MTQLPSTREKEHSHPTCASLCYHPYKSESRGCMSIAAFYRRQHWLLVKALGGFAEDQTLSLEWQEQLFIMWLHAITH